MLSNIQDSIEDEINCKFKVRTTFPKNKSDTDMLTVLLAPYPIVTQHIISVFHLRLLLKTHVNRKKSFGSKISSRVVDFN